MYTKGKWELSKHGTPDYAPQYGIHNGGIKDFCITKGENAEANARRICQCVNNYDAIVGALEELLEATRIRINIGEARKNGYKVIEQAESEVNYE